MWTPPHYRSHHGFFVVGIKVFCYVYYSVLVHFRYFKRLLRSFWIKNISYYFLFMFKYFEVIISSNVVKHNCLAPMWQMTMSKQSANNDLNITLVFPLKKFDSNSKLFSFLLWAFVKPYKNDSLLTLSGFYGWQVIWQVFLFTNRYLILLH